MTAAQGLVFYRHLLERERDFRRDSARWFTIGPALNIIALSLGYISSPLFHGTGGEIAVMALILATHAIVLTLVARRMGEEARHLVDGDGTPFHWAFTANYDGKDNPVTGNSPYGDTVALTRVDPKTTRIINKQGGKVTSTQTIVVSGDGKTRTTTTKGKNAKGEAVESMSFSEKQ